MWLLALKAILSGLVVAGASELAQRNTLAGAVLISLPLTSILALGWLYGETGDLDRVVRSSWSIMWIVLPSVTLFAALPLLVRAGLSFWPAMGGAIAVMIAAYAVWVAVLGRLGVKI